MHSGLHSNPWGPSGEVKLSYRYFPESKKFDQKWIIPCCKQMPSESKKNAKSSIKLMHFHLHYVVNKLIGQMLCNHSKPFLKLL